MRARAKLSRVLFSSFFPTRAERSEMLLSRGVCTSERKRPRSSERARPQIDFVRSRFSANLSLLRQTERALGHLPRELLSRTDTMRTRARTHARYFCPMYLAGQCAANDGENCGRSKFIDCSAASAWSHKGRERLSPLINSRVSGAR